MATKVYDEHTIQLQDGKELTIRPLVLKKLRKFYKVLEKLQDDKGVQDLDNITVLVEAAALAFTSDYPELAKDLDALEDILDLDTMWKILEVSGGVSFNPNLLAQMTEATDGLT